LPDFHPLHPRWITLQRIGGLITLFIVGTPTFAGAVMMMFMGMLPGIWRWTPGIAWVALMLLLLWSGLIFPPIAYRYIRYRVCDLGVEIRQGVFWKHVINVPRSRVQHTDVRQGPLQRRYRIGTLIMHTAGTTNHTVVLGGLPHDRALAIRDFLLHEAEKDQEITPRPQEGTTSSRASLIPGDDGEPNDDAAAASEQGDSGTTVQADPITPEMRGDDA